MRAVAVIDNTSILGGILIKLPLFMCHPAIVKIRLNYLALIQRDISCRVPVSY